MSERRSLAMERLLVAPFLALAVLVIATVPLSVAVEPNEPLLSLEAPAARGIYRR